MECKWTDGTQSWLIRDTTKLRLTRRRWGTVQRLVSPSSAANQRTSHETHSRDDGTARLLVDAHCSSSNLLNYPHKKRAATYVTSHIESRLLISLQDQREEWTQTSYSCCTRRLHQSLACASCLSFLSLLSFLSPLPCFLFLSLSDLSFLLDFSSVRSCSRRLDACNRTNKDASTRAGSQKPGNLVTLWACLVPRNW